MKKSKRCFLLVLSLLVSTSTASASQEEGGPSYTAQGEGSAVDLTRSQVVEVPGSSSGVVGGGSGVGGSVGGSGEVGGGVDVGQWLGRCVRQALEEGGDPGMQCGVLLSALVMLGSGSGGGVGDGGGGGVVVTAGDVQRVVASGSGVVRQPPGPQALVSKAVIVYTSGREQVVDTQVGGSPVRVVATPVSYTWHWGDGSVTTTEDPGAPYPHHTVFHRYSATARGVVITVTTTWRAVYSVDGGPQRPVVGELTTTSSAEPFDLVRLVTYLTDDGEQAQGR